MGTGWDNHCLIGHCVSFKKVLKIWCLRFRTSSEGSSGKIWLGVKISEDPLKTEGRRTSVILALGSRAS